MPAGLTGSCNKPRIRIEWETYVIGRRVGTTMRSDAPRRLLVRGCAS
jgi:hypothetical protein